MTLDTESLLLPISGPNPGGTDIRSGEEYDGLTAEIDKMSSPSSTGQIDWLKVETTASRLLAQQSKDFMLAAWLSAAWMQSRGIEGLAAGLRLHEQLIARFWDSAQPPLKRLRGRRNALQWWVERASDWLDGQEEIAPLQPPFHQAMLDDAQSLDTRLGELDPECPPLQPLIQRIRRLSRIEPEPQPATSEERAPSSSGTAEMPTGAAASQPQGAAAPAAASSAPSPAPTAFRPGGDQHMALDSEDAVLHAMQPALDHLGQLGSALRSLSPLNPASIDLCRLTARAVILAAPPSQQGITALMPPPVAIQDAFATIMQNGNAEGLIEFCESRLATFPYWLDLDRESARGFSLMGSAGAPLRQAVIDHVLCFTQRVPDIEHLAFSDGTPFASEATRQWLASCRAARQSSGDGPADRASQALTQARTALADGQTDQALQIYQTLIETTWAGRDRFLARLAMLEALPQIAPQASPQALARHLADECLKHDLGAWEPDLARRSWQTILRALNRMQPRPDPAEDAHLAAAGQALIEQARLALAQLDPGALLR